MVEITKNDILETYDAIKFLYYEAYNEKEIKERVLPFGIKYRLGDIKKTFEEASKEILNDKNDLVVKYGEEITQEDGTKIFKVKDSELENFYADYNEMLNSKKELAYVKLSKADVQKLEDREIDIPERYIEFLYKYVFEG